MRELRLFVGGPTDGQWWVVDCDHWRVVEEVSDDQRYVLGGPDPPELKIHEYHGIDLAPGVTVMLHPDLDKASLMQRLVAEYRPA